MERLIFIFIVFLTTLQSYAIDTRSFLKRVISKAVKEPSAFFREIKSDTEITLPVKSGYDNVFTYSIIPSFFPFAFISPSFTRRVYLESSLPQIDIGGGLEYFSIGSTLARSSEYIENISFWGYHLKSIFSNSFSSKIRNFYGIKYSYNFCELDLSDSKKYELLGVEIDEFKFKDFGFYVVFGVEIIRDVNKYFAIQLNYDMSNKNVIMKTGWYGRWFEIGLNFYPDGIIPIHPVWNMRLSF
ncbi:MAG: hypothetical protein N2446_03370 [Elusimicrobiales bacterium]|nr:hypothetical protein [Elusimicrobiales bacterium]